MRHKTSIRTILLSFIILGIIIFPLGPAVADNREDVYAKIKILSRVLYEIQERFVEEKEAEELIYGAIKGMVQTLDPHSSFLTPSEFKDLQMETRGSFTGVGTEITLRDGVLTVVAPIDGTPAYRAGIQSGDAIIKIDGKPTKNMTLREAVKLIRGPRGTTVVLTVTRKSESKPLDIAIVRDVIPLRSVRFETLEQGYGYMRISNFQAKTTTEARKALIKLQSGPVPLKGLIMDLRSNPGGLLDQAVKVADLFLKNGLIVYTKGRSKHQNMKFKAKKSIVVEDYPIVLMVNEGSASASEILAGALQDHKRALILGARTFGKASVQTIISFSDGSGLRLTTARYYTPSGRSIQAEGIAPDVTVASRFKGKVIREKDLKKHLKGEHEMEAEKADKPAESEVEEEAAPKEKPIPREKIKPLSEMTLEERFEIDPQLKKAFELLKQGEVPSLLKMAGTAK
ncbi:MAG: S41 family peptidase [Deltaproteobacteria bacterium]|nr:S41 family peptidase [Deltaproteobacteria bacterium]MBW2085204.1 S41 family peptidase [Deltaproteobacteria bacterium]